MDTFHLEYHILVRDLVKIIDLVGRETNEENFLNSLKMLVEKIMQTQLMTELFIMKYFLQISWN